MTKKLSNRENSGIEKLEKLYRKIYIRLVRIIYSSIFSFLEDEFLNGLLENVRKGNGRWKKIVVNVLRRIYTTEEEEEIGRKDRCFEFITGEPYRRAWPVIIKLAFIHEIIIDPVNE